MIPDDTLLMVAREAEAHRAGNHKLASYFLKGIYLTNAICHSGPCDILL